MHTPSSLYLLTAALFGTLLYGLVLVLAPGLAHQGFGLLMFNDAQRVLGFAPEALGYVSLMTGVLGAVMAGWTLGLLALIRWLWRDAPVACWRIVALSLGSWYVIDSLFSLTVGAWQNAAANSVFALLYGVALWLARPGQEQLQARRQTSLA